MLIPVYRADVRFGNTVRGYVYDFRSISGGSGQFRESSWSDERFSFAPEREPLTVEAPDVWHLIKDGDDLVLETASEDVPSAERERIDAATLMRYVERGERGYRVVPDPAGGPL